MNVLIPFSWLKDYVKTNATIEGVASLLSLHSFSVEKIIDGDVFEIEVTPNRGDALSVLGISREMMAVLPVKEFEADWVKEDSPVKKYSGKDTLKVNIKDSTLVPRFSAVVLDKVTIKDSPSKIRERLSKVGIRPINNVVDITNYLMIELGQPMHVFDYDKILGHQMTVRESKKGEKLTTLDGVERSLPEGVIVIEDGEGRLIDLCGIMGAKNSEVDDDTKKILLFVQVYDPVRIRKTSMSIGHRTDAALRFEKGVDFEGVLQSLRRAVKMLEEHAGCEVSSELIDITGTVYTPKNIIIDYENINKVAGLEVPKRFVDTTLSNLGFIVKDGEAEVPSWRYDDINIPEDLAEEVIRIYGYYNLPNNLPSGDLPKRLNTSEFTFEEKAKNFLKYSGFFECYSYSFVPKDLTGSDRALKLKNPLNADYEYLRTSLVPQLLGVVQRNKGYSEALKVFELSQVYLPKEGDLPAQPLKLALASRKVDYLQFKGYIQALFDDLKVGTNFDFEINEYPNGVLTCEINFEDLLSAKNKPTPYTPIVGFNSIKEDITLVLGGDEVFKELVKEIEKTDPRISKVLFKDIFQNFLTLSLEFLDKSKQISSVETQEIREQISKVLKAKFGIQIKK